MKLLLDQGLPVSAARKLRNHGWDVTHVAEVNLHQATDAELLNHAAADNSVCVTLDSDFHALLAIRGSSKPSVIRIRQEGLKGSAIAAVLLTIWPCIEARVHDGAMVTVTPRTVRVRSLPIIRD